MRLSPVADALVGLAQAAAAAAFLYWLNPRPQTLMIIAVTVVLSIYRARMGDTNGYD